MAKQLNVNLSIGADTSKAKAQLQDLQKTLQSVAKLPGKSSSLFDDTEIKAASKAALELQQHLEKATNVNTGKLDLSRLSSSLKSSNKDLNTYYSQLIRCGSQGQEAFLKIAQAVASAEAPVTRVNKRLSEFATTLKNTARWQLSSSLIHGFMGTLQSAYGYAQDLNESLNDIRIVTGKSADEMERFAKEANRSAKELSATTRDYTDASLIFYQQGLDADAVKERTDITIKMAHAAGENATEVSSYMTAIWNNFDDGSKSLEYYGDVLAKLGADTAASSAEIAEGLEKFASIGETVGLSYEYASAAVTTVVDKTRASADTVGTAFKTIFARLQGLQLGETLEDGVDLNKYSKALEAVGVKVLDLNGNLKSADSIVYDLGMKWNLLSSAQQTALAQTVAGTRQYTQLMSLMNNFDDFLGNVDSAKNSEGTLSVQADIYAQSWEAARDRVQVAAENIYDSLIDDDFFITLLNGFEKILTSVGGFVDGLGGMKGALMMVGTVFMTYFAKSMPQVLTNLKENLLVITGQTGKLMADVQKKTKDKLVQVQMRPDVSNEYKIKAEGILRVTEMQEKLLKSSKFLTEQEKAEYKARIENVQSIYEEIAALAKKAEEAEKTSKKSSKKLVDGTKQNVRGTINSYFEAEKKVSRAEDKVEKAKGDSQAALDADDVTAYEQAESAVQNFTQLAAQARQEADALDLEISRLGEAYGLTDKQMEALIENTSEAEAVYQSMNNTIQQTTNDYKDLVTQNTRINSLGEGVTSLAKDWKKNAAEIKESDNGAKNLKKTMEDYLKVIKRVAKENGLDKLTEADFAQVQRALDGAEGDVDALIEAFEDFSAVVEFECGEALRDLDTEIETLSDRMNNMGFNQNDLSAMREDAEAAAQAVNELEISMENAEGAAGEDPVGAFHMSTALTQLGGVVMATSQTLNALKSSFDVLSDPDASGLEKFGAAVGAVSAVVTGMAPVMALATTAMNANTEATKGNIIQKGLSKIADTGMAIGATLIAKAKGIETAAVWENNTAWYANPAIWIAAVIVGVVAAVALLTVGIMKLTEWLIKGNKIENENAETLIENAEKTKELAEANKELSTTIEDLVSSYESLSAAGKDTSEVLEEIKNNIPELIQSYKDLAESMGLPVDKIEDLQNAANLGTLTGDFSSFTEQKEELDKELSKEVAHRAKMSAEAATKNLAIGVQDNGGKYSKDTGKLTLDVGGVGDEESEAQDILMKQMGDYAVNSDGWFKKGVELSANVNSPTEFVDYYEKMVAARDEMLATMDQKDLQDSDIFREINEAIEGSAEHYEAAKEQAEEYVAVAGDALRAELGNGSNLKNMEEYLAYREQYIKMATEQYGLTKEQAEAYLDESASLSNVAQQYQLATVMAEKFGHIDTDSQAFEGVADAFYQEMQAVYGDLSEQELQVAIAVANSADTIQEFSEQFQVAMVQSTRMGMEASADVAKSVMEEALEEGSIDMSSLFGDENFTEYLEQIGESQQTLASKNYDELYNIVSDFYNRCNQTAFESFEIEQELYAQQIADRQGQITAYYDTMSGENAAAAQQLQQDYADLMTELQSETDETEIDRLNMEMDELALKFREDYGFEITSNADTISGEIDSLLEKINELQDQKIEMAMDWSGTDELANSFQQAGKFARTIKDDTKKVGENYTMTAEQLREWCKVYPELGSLAKTTNEGIIEMNAAEVDAFIEGKETELAADVDTKIAELEAQKEVLQADLETKQKELEAAELLAEGKLNLEDVSAQYLVDLRGNLTQYFMDLGLDEQTANAAALETMGLNEEEYAKLVADACQTNAENQAISAENGANAQVSSLSQLAKRWASFGSYLVQNIGPILLEIGKAILDPTRSVADVMSAAWEASAITIDSSGNKSYTSTNGGYTFDSGDASQVEAAFKGVSAPQLDGVKSQMEQLEDAIGSIDGQIAYLQGLKNQGLENLGETDINEVDGTNDANKNKSKEEKEKDDKEGFDFENGELKILDEEIERYHEIENTLESIGRDLDEITKRKDRAFGKEKLKIMKEEAAALERQKEAQEAYNKEIADYLKKDKEALKKYGASYDSDRNITNYDEMVQQQVEAYNSAYAEYINSKNAAVDAYNGSEKTEIDEALYNAQIKKAEAEWAAAQEVYKNFEEDIKQYEESVDLFEESEQTLQDIKNQLYDLALEEVEYSLELQIDVAEDSLKYLDYLLSKLDDSAYDAAESIALLGKQAEVTMGKIGSYQNAIRDLLGNHVESGEITEGEIEDFLAGGQIGADAVAKLNLTDAEVQSLRAWKDSLLEQNQALMNLRQEVRDKVMPAFQELTEEMSNQIEKIEHLQSVTESYRNIIDIVGKDYLGISDEMMSALNQAQVDMAVDNLTATKAKLDGMKDMRAEAHAALEDAMAEDDEDLIKFWQDTLDEIDGEIRSAEQDYMASWEAALQEAADAFDESITASLEKFTDALAGEMGSLEALQSEFDRQRQVAERYLPEYKQIYELSKLTRELNKATDETDSVKAKQEYKALLEEINEIEESGREISEYELKQLQAKFDLKQAELALEEAQNAKSQVRMTRDNEGNWGYVYTADQDAIDNAMQNYEDKLYALNDLAYQYAKEQEDALVQLQAEFAEAIQNIQAEVGSDEWYAEVERITAFYTEQNGYHLEQLGLALDDAGLKFTDTAFSALTGFQTAEGYQRAFNDNIGNPTKAGTLLGDITKAYEDWKNNVEKAMNAAGTSTDGYAQHMMNATEQAVKDTQTIADETIGMSVTVGEKFGEVVGAVQEWENQYGSTIDEMILKNEGLITSLDDVIQKLSDYVIAKEEANNIDVNPTPTISSGGDTGSGGDSGSGGNGGDSGGGSDSDGGANATASAIASEAAAIIAGVHNGSIPQTSSGWVPSAQSAGYSADAISIARKAFNESKDGAGYDYCYKKALELAASYDTGGYTGAWGPEGRLAILHQKELVLNAHDTDNMLRMMNEMQDAMRMAIDAIEINAMSASQGLNSMIQSTGRIYSMDNTLRQDVTIHAEFPDVQDRYEIESAFENLINRASQYANREV